MRKATTRKAPAKKRAIRPAKPGAKKITRLPAKRTAKKTRKPAARKTAARKTAKRRNGEPTAADLYARFHGKPSTRTRQVDQELRFHESLAQLGKLVSLDVLTIRGDDVRTVFTSDGVTVAAEPEGRQIYFVGGRQTLDLSKFGITRATEKDLVLLGVCTRIEYHTSKDFHDFEPVDYHHKFGEETGEQPLLIYDTLNNAISLVGGAYRVKRPGIIN